MVVPSAKVGAGSGVAVVSPPASPPPEAQPASVRAPAAAKATRVSRVLFMSYQSFAVDRTARGGPSFMCPGRGAAAEVCQCSRIFDRKSLRPLALRVREELLGGRLFDDRAVGHEQHAVGGLAREAHLVGDDDHGHAVAGEADHDIEHLVDHLGVERAGRLVHQDELRDPSRASGRSRRAAADRRRAGPASSWPGWRRRRGPAAPSPSRRRPCATSCAPGSGRGSRSREPSCGRRG